MTIIHGLSSGQVLQRLRNRTATAEIRGASTERGDVHARITAGTGTLTGWRNRKVGRAANGGFFAKLNGIPAGGPYQITLWVDVGRVPPSSAGGRLSRGGKKGAASGDAAYNLESVTVRCVWVGDVWLLGGQSNMQGCGNLDKAPASHSKVRAMYMDDHWDIAREPIHFLQDSSDRVHYHLYSQMPIPPAERQRLRKDLVKGVGPGIYFGKEMIRRSGGIPQGLICAAHGGTSMEDWDPAKKHLGGDSQYGSMLRMVRKTGQPVAGVLWYQGESDCTEAAAPHYTRRMEQLVSEIRRDFRQPNLPFIMVQIGRVYGSAFTPKPWNDIQAQQSQLPRHIRNLECVSVIDLPLDDTIHISSAGYPRLGARLARLADRMVYGNRKELPAPELASISRIRDARFKKICIFGLDLTFKNVVGGLRSQGMPSGFALVDEKHRNPNSIYKTTLHGSKVRLETGLSANFGEYKIMYGHGCAPNVNITDSRDMPIPVIGPERIETTVMLSPFIDQWLVSGIQPITRPLAALPPPRRSAALKLRKREFENFLVDMHETWENRSGHGFFFSEISLPENMKLNLRLGYDGPIRVWMDDKAFFTDLHGTNPAAPDQAIRPLSLKKGLHRISVAMDLNNGRAWGFFMRFERRDVTKAQRAKGSCVLPVFSL